MSEKNQSSIKERIKGAFFEQEGFSIIRKKTLNTRTLLIGGIPLLGILLLLLLSRPSEQRDNGETSSPDPIAHGELTPLEEKTVKEKTDYVSLPEILQKKHDIGSPFSPHQNYNASQVVINEGGKLALPPGTTIPAMLTHKVISKALNATVMAITTEPAYLDNQMIIPERSTLLGQASHDEEAQKVQIAFHTVVFPDHKQYSILAHALDTSDEGSSGLSGRYHSKKGQRLAGALLSRFAGGLTKGLQNRTVSPYGVETQEGSWENGVLEGASEVAMEEASRYSHSLKELKGVIEVPSGYPFLILLEQRFEK